MIIFVVFDHNLIFDNDMTQELRKKTILKLLEQNEEVSIHEIVLRCNISEITARRDLSILEKNGLLRRTHGGAVRSSVIHELFGFDKNKLERRNQKMEICKLAASLIEENDTIYMDCGTTVYYLARFLANFKKLRVITNSLPVVSVLMPYPHIKVYLIGGELDNTLKALYGPMTENLLSRYKADKAFIGAGGVSVSYGLSCHQEKEASITLKMAEDANNVYLLCDSSKIEKNSYFNYSALSLVDFLITDKEISPIVLELFKNKNINVLVT
jgi:DeoR family transcriptional regulator, fructose operon transcriptional repressor